MSELADADARRAAIAERDRNVIVEASAGTGKTTLVVERLLALTAPSDDRSAIPLERLAAITFTRKAAGELRVRTRQRLLAELAQSVVTTPRAHALRHALAAIDTAHIGTIHGFADRLLRKFPAQARLDPHYQLEDDPLPLIRECFEQLLHAAESRTMADLLHGSRSADRADEAAETLLAAQRAELRLVSQDSGHWCAHGLAGLFESFVLHRDAPISDPPPAGFDRPSFDRVAGEYLQRVDGIEPASSGARWLLDLGARLRADAHEHDPAVLFRSLVARCERGPRGKASNEPRRGHDFGGDAQVWDVWKAFAGDDRKKPVRPTPLRDDLVGPLHRWLAMRLARLRPVVLDVYERVKARHQVVDHVDLLLRLRDLLRDDPAIRHACQAFYDHIFVDEFQDTDPLQAEIIVLLCERAGGARWEAATLGPGTLTIVGDPKQSIYRFRRADLAIYQRVIELVERSPHISVQLTTSFRSTPALVGWLNDQFDRILGVRGPQARARDATGEVVHDRLTEGRASGAAVAVHVLPLAVAEPGGVAACRALEASATARYVRWLVQHSTVTVTDPATGQPRRITHGDIAVLAITTTQLPTLFDAFDRDDVPYAARGGSLFLRDPLHRQFLLGLCALADRDDGVANAALLRPPFFALGPKELARARAGEPTDPVDQARAMIRELRRQRFARSPDVTARALLELTGCGRTIARGPNGRQRLAALRELCFQVGVRAVTDRTDFDATMERLRAWVEDPAGFDPPHPVTGDAVRVLTIHQAKGLEFPVVVLWDARAAWKDRPVHDAWTVARTSDSWAMRLDPLVWSEPSGMDLAERERAMYEAERKRLVYVAATRARDLLVIPTVGPPDGRWIGGTLVGGARSSAVVERAAHAEAAPAAWFLEGRPGTDVGVVELTNQDEELQRVWEVRADEAAQPRARPSAFTNAASPRMFWGRKGRYGPRFGDTVHAAIALVMTGAHPLDRAVQLAAARAGLGKHLIEASQDVVQAVGALRDLGIEAATTPLRFEYPVAGMTTGGPLVSGYVDLVALHHDGLVVVDFKTDAPPSEEDSIQPAYLAQLRGYASVLAGAHLAPGPIRSGLLFTSTGRIHWVSDE